MKKEFKKSLSLFLAVIMLLSCWVWVEPTAMAATTVNYTLTVKITASANGKGSGHVDVYYYEYDENGKLDTTKEAKYTGTELGSAVWQNGFEKTNITIPGFPSRLYYSVAEKDGTKSTFNGHLDAWIGNTQIIVGKDFNNDSSSKRTLNVRCQGYSISGVSNDNDTVASSTANWTVPTATTLTGIGAIGATDTITINKLPDGENITKTASIQGVKDQYGVTMPNYYLPQSGVSYSLDNDGKSVPSSAATVSGSGSTATVTLKDEVQTLFNNSKTNYLNLNASWKGSTASSTVKIVNPSYTVNFYGNGGKIGAQTDGANAADIYTLGGDSGKLYYGADVGTAPVYASRENYSFLGFYQSSNQGGDLIFLGNDTSELDNKITFVNMTEDNPTKIGDVNKDKVYDGDQSWYAAWQSKEVKATFISQDNQVIGTLSGRYNNTLIANNMFGSEAKINETLKDNYKGTSVKFNGDNEPIFTTSGSNLVFDGWEIIKADDASLLGKGLDTRLYGDVTFQAVYRTPTAKKYTVKFYNGKGFEDSNVILSVGDLNYRDNVTVPSEDKEPTLATNAKYSYEFAGWAENIGTKYYTVDDNGLDENGAVIPYTSKDTDEFLVKGDASYVPVFKRAPREYTVTYKYTVDGGEVKTVEDKGYHYGDALKLPEGYVDNYSEGPYRYYVDGWYVTEGGDIEKFEELAVTGDITVTAHYGEPEKAKFTINFFDKDGKLLNEDNNIYSYNATITEPYLPPVIETEGSRFVLKANKWTPEFSNIAEVNKDYYADYEEKVYADVSFYNEGKEIYTLKGKENSLFVGDLVPNFNDNDYQLPTKESDVIGDYIFDCWVDSEGNEIDFGTTTIKGHTQINATFTTKYKDYTVTFKPDNGEEDIVQTYHYGDEVTAPANPVKDRDNTYTYKFLSWTPAVSDVCYGNATYTAAYSRNYRYYPVTWLDADKNLFASSKYVFGEKFAPIGEPEYNVQNTTGYSWVIDKWVMCDAAGNDVIVDGKKVTWKLGDKISEGITDAGYFFYPTYKEEAAVYTVTFLDEDATTVLGTAKALHDTPFAEVAQPKAVKAATDAQHFVFNTWVGAPVDNPETTDKDESVVTGDLSVIASYKAENHNKVIYEVVKAPTCTETGLVNKKCATDACGMIDYDVVEPVIPDTVAPDITLTLGDKVWKNTEADISENAEVTYVSAKTNILVSASDLNNWSKPFNLDGSVTRRVGKIDYIVSTEVFNDLTALDALWVNAYDYDAVYASVLADACFDAKLTVDEYNALEEDDKKKLAVDKAVADYMYSYEANIGSFLGDLELTDGEEYIIYVRASDRTVNGSTNTSYGHTGKFCYGSTAPTIKIEGAGSASKLCETAGITVTDDTDSFTIKVDGDDIIASYDETGKKATFDFAATGLHTITVTDKHGNMTTKTFEILGNHTYRNYVVAPTCIEAGERYDMCTLCGVKANVTVLAATGHKFNTYTDKKADCINDGYRTYKCSICKDATVKVTFVKAENGEVTLTKLAGGSDKVINTIDVTKVTVTVEDMKHLLAKGEHTYAKVLDEDGNETSEDKWIIDKEATCSATGSKHIDCTVCGQRTTEVIDIAPDAHKFYRARVAQEATCTTDGWKNQSCKYCGHVEEKVEILPALGHTPGDYRTITEATCETDGEEVLTCSVCGVDIGEADKDGKYSVPPVTKKIEKLGHIMVVDDNKTVLPYIDEETGLEVKGYYVLVCARGCGHEEKGDEIGLEDIKTYTIKFIYGEDNVLTFENKKAGETITADLVATPVKASDNTYNYVFSHWADAEGKAVKFPVTVTADAEYTPVFEAQAILHTLTYKYEDGKQFGNKTGYLKYGDKVYLKDGPAKASDGQYKYTFAGWTDGTSVYAAGAEYTVSGNATLTATYTKKLVVYYVSYGYSRNDIIDTIAVNAGATAQLPTELESKTDATLDYHYAFDGWDKEYALTKVESNVYTSAKFTTVGHTWVADNSDNVADCENGGIIKYTCSVCGYEKTEAGLDALGHDYKDPTPVFDEKTGTIVYECQREGCDSVLTEDATYKVTFVAYDDVIAREVKNVVWGTKLTADKYPASATKPTDNYKYTFKAWGMYVPQVDDEGETVTDENGKEVLVLAEVDPSTVVIKADTTFYAIFTKSDVTYTVNFRLPGSNVVLETKTVKAGSKVEFTGDETLLVNEYDANYHYSFNGWSEDLSEVNSDMNVTAVFKAVKHEYTESVLGEATCTTGKGTRHTCSCGKFYDVTGSALGHKWVEDVEKRVNPADGKDGTMYYYCEREGCKETKTEPIKWVDDTMTIELVVKDSSGNPVEGAVVDLYRDNEADPIDTQKTNSEGQVVFVVEKDHSYSYLVSYEGKAATDKPQSVGSGSTNVTIEAHRCSCACHGDGIWSAIFRFFHKVIKMFTGEFKCCKDPDSRYN